MRSSWMAVAAVTTMSLAACGGDPCVRLRPGEAPREGACAVFAEIEGTGQDLTLVPVAGELTTDTRWTADKVYVLRDFVFVRGPAVLTIEPGTEIRGERGSALVVARGAKLIADGTRERPIVFTSAKPPGTRYRGDWGGVNLLGRAPVNVSGGENALSGVPISNGLGYYGGDDPDDSSGIVRFVRIEFAGYALTPDVKLNAFTCAGCGRGTAIDYIQAHRGADDGIELFGGTVDLKHAVITYSYDDGLDWEMGWTGRVQFVVVAQEAANGDSLYEADNSRDNPGATPRSQPVIYNATLIGSRKTPAETAQVQRGMVLRRGTGAHLYNHLVTGVSVAAVDVRDRSTVGVADAGDLFIRSSLFFANGQGRQFPSPGDDGFDEARFFAQPALANHFDADPLLVAPYEVEAPSWMPRGGSPCLSAGTAPPDDGFFDPTANFIGAFGDEDWTAGWTAYPRN